MGIGIWQLLLLLAVVLVIFGPGKLPNAIKDIAKSLRTIKEDSKSEKDENDEPKTIVINPKK
jgi:sec-independent protein translocase protein TatA